MTDREQARAQAINRAIRTLNVALDHQLRTFISSVTARCPDLDPDDLSALFEEAAEQCEINRAEFRTLIEQHYRDQ